VTLVLLQAVHTAVTLYNYACLFYIISCHVRGRHTFFLKIAYISIGIEAVALLGFGFACPLRVLVDRLYSPFTADTFFPDFAARLIMPVGIALFLVAVLTGLLARRRRKPK
jgi:hypothetical protein